MYGEVYRVLRPGAFFASYEWVATKNFDPNNPEHVQIMDQINYGNGLPVSKTAEGRRVGGRKGGGREEEGGTERKPCMWMGGCEEA